MPDIGRKTWAVADGYLPSWSEGPKPEMESHGSLGVLNAGERPASLRLTVYFSDREPAGPYRFEVGARRTRHVRLTELDDPEEIPRGVDFALVLTSDVPVVVQHTRLDSRQAANGLFSTIAFPV